LAVEADEFDITNDILQLGYDIDATPDKNRSTALQISCKKNVFNIVELLIKALCISTSRGLFYQ
jgi:ankyrin repeat protein